MSIIKSLSIVIPAYNEELALNAVLDEIVTLVDVLGIPYEIIVVNDGSNDSSAELLKIRAVSDPRIKPINHEYNFGKGQALRTGFANSLGYDWTLIIDADRQIPMSELDSFAHSTHQADVLIGKRLDKHYSLYRKCVSHFNRYLVRTLYGVSVYDVNCPFKLIKSARLGEIQLSSRGFGFDAELLWKLSLAGATIVELPVASQPRQTGVSKVTPRILAKCVLELLFIRLRG